MSELSFLLELLLEHELQKDTQKLIRERIKEIEAKPQSPAPMGYNRPMIAGQAPSMQRAVADLEEDKAIQANFAQAQNPAQIAQSPAVAQAMAHRAALIAQATSGVEEKGRRSPRKF